MQRSFAAIMASPTRTALALILVFVFATASDCSSSSPTEPEASVDFTCFNPSSTSLECTSTFFSVRAIIEFFWEATGQLAQRGQRIVTSTWDYSRQCSNASDPIDATIRLTLTDDANATIGPAAHIYPVCLTSSQTTATQVLAGFAQGDVRAARKLVREELGVDPRIYERD